MPAGKFHTLQSVEFQVAPACKPSRLCGLVGILIAERDRPTRSSLPTRTGFEFAKPRPGLNVAGPGDGRPPVSNEFPQIACSGRGNPLETAETGIVMANYFIIGGDDKEYGPISDADVRLWIAEGRLNATSRAKAESDAEFRALAQFPEFAAALAPQASPATIAPLNRQTELDDANWQAVVLAREPELKLGECLAAGWSFLGANAGFLVGAVLLTWITNLFFVVFSVSVPLVGPLVLLCFNGIIMGGFYLACLRRLRGEDVSPTEVFCGFKIAFVQLLLTGLVGMLLTELSACCLILPAVYLSVAWAFALPLVADKRMSFWPAMELSRKVVTRVWFEAFALLLIAFLPMLIFQVFNLVMTGKFFFGLYEEANHNWQQLAQMMQSKTGEIQKLTIKATLIGQGILLLNLFYCVGVIIHAYENLFGPKKS
jgi:hypothetical protein